MKKLIKTIISITIEIIVLITILNSSKHIRMLLNFGTISFNINSDNMQEILYNVEMISQNDTLTINILKMPENINYTISKTHTEAVVIIWISFYAFMLILICIFNIIKYLFKHNEKMVQMDTDFQKDKIDIPNYNPLIVYQLNYFNCDSINSKYITITMIQYLIAKGYIMDDENNYIIKNKDFKNLSKSELLFMKLFFINNDCISKKDLNSFVLSEYFNKWSEELKEEAITLGFMEQAKYKIILQKILDSKFHKKIYNHFPNLDNENSLLIIYTLSISLILLIIILLSRDVGIILIAFGIIYLFYLLKTPLTINGKIEKMKHKILKEKLKEKQFLTELEEAYYRILKKIYI